MEVVSTTDKKNLRYDSGIENARIHTAEKWTHM